MINSWSVQGRFDKKEYGGLPNTVILGDNGCLYGLLNGIDNRSRPLLQNVEGVGKGL